MTSQSDHIPSLYPHSPHTTSTRPATICTTRHGYPSLPVSSSPPPLLSLCLAPLCILPPLDRHDMQGESRGRLVWLAQIASALHYLHQSRAVIHGDLHCGNILLCAATQLKAGLPRSSAENLTAKVTDFGRSVKITTQEGKQGIWASGWPEKPESFDGSLLRHEAAPEMKVSTDSVPSLKTDVWDFGILVASLLSGQSCVCKQISIPFCTMHVIPGPCHEDTTRSSPHHTTPHHTTPHHTTPLHTTPHHTTFNSPFNTTFNTT